MKKKDYGIFIHRIAYSESSIIASFYTLESGLSQFLYQGGKKKGGGLVPMGIYELEFYNRNDSQLTKLTGTAMVHPFHSIVSDPIKSTIAYFLCDIIRNTVHNNQPDKVIYQFLSQSIIELDHSNHIQLYPIQFLANYTKYLGIQPDCSIVNPICFDLDNGEFFNHLVPNSITVEGQLAKDLWHFFNEDDIIPQSNRKDLLNALLKYYNIHIPRFDISKSLEIIQEVIYS